MSETMAEFVNDDATHDDTWRDDDDPAAFLHRRELRQDAEADAAQRGHPCPDCEGRGEVMGQSGTAMRQTYDEGGERYEYEEPLYDLVPCGTCDGTGRIPDAPDMQAAYDAMYADAEEAQLPVPAIPWDYQLTNRKEAAYVVGAIQMVERQIKDRRAQYEIEVAKLRRLVDFWRTHYTPAVEAVVRAELVAAGGKGRSITLATGVGKTLTRAGFKKSRERLDVVNEQAAVSWADENLPQAVQKTTKFSLLRDPVTQHIKATGEKPDGCEYHPGGVDTFFIR